MTSSQRLLDILPEIFRTRDGAMASEIAARMGFEPPSVDGDPEGPLHSLLEALALQFDALEAEVDNLYDDLFIETCADWLVPYIGDLVGARIVDVDDSVSARRQVASTIELRRSKGTARALAERARKLMRESSEAIEYFQHLVVTLNLNFPGDNRAMTVALNGEQGRKNDLPHVVGQHIPELRDMRDGGRFAIPNIGVRCWTLRSLPHVETTPLAASDGGLGHFRFSPTGADIALWRKREPVPDDPFARARLRVEEIPGPIPMIDAVDRPDVYFGDEKSIEMVIRGDAVSVDDICFCHLGDAPGGGWNQRGTDDELEKIRIDPVRGRFVLPEDLSATGAEDIRVLYHYGTAFDAGGGYYRQLTQDPATAVDPDDLRDVEVEDTAAAAQAALQDALSDLAARPHVRLLDGQQIVAPKLTPLPANRSMVIEAGPDIWPSLQLSDIWRLTEGDDSELTVRGLRLINGTLQIDTEGLKRLRLVDCTILPGLALNPDGSPVNPSSIALDIQQNGLEVECERCVLGRVALGKGSHVILFDSIVDASAVGEVAIAGHSGGFEGVLSAERTTVLGRVRVREMGEVSECLFARRPKAPSSETVTVERLQYGCVRYTGLPPLASVPRRYRCYPNHETEDPRDPTFAALTPAKAAYGRLLASSPVEILGGADGGTEMGITNRTSWQRRKHLLARDLPDWTPFAMVAGEEMMD
jgi:hypothetical protein